MAQSTTTLESLLERTRDLYSLPQVAAQVVKLTAEPNIDVAALKQCIECDAALASKILRVVNSSLFGLGSEVRDLGQALALLGIKPLKLLALGFCLPDRLFLDVAREDLQRYWTSSLTRAVAGRELAHAMGTVSGDEAFITGLLQDVGQLVLIKELGEVYVRFQSRVREERGDLLMLEREALGFDHRQLSIMLLTHWGLPQSLVHCLEAAQQFAEQNGGQATTTLAPVLHVGDLLAELISEKRLGVLPDLMEYGGGFCRLDRPAVKDLVRRVQVNVEALADVLAVPLADELDFEGVIAEAHSQLAQVAADAAVPLARLHSSEEATSDAIWDELHALTEATREFLAEETVGGTTAGSGPRDDENAAQLRAALQQRAVECRSRRTALTLILAEATEPDGATPGRGSEISGVVETACRNLIGDGNHVHAAEKGRWGIVLPDCERREAVSLGQILTEQVLNAAMRRSIWIEPSRIHIGIATVDVVPINFDTSQMVESAERCLNAAGVAGGTNVKSIAL